MTGKRSAVPRRRKSTPGRHQTLFTETCCGIECADMKPPASLGLPAATGSYVGDIAGPHLVSSPTSRRHQALRLAARLRSCR
jgi:hypothetical protein